MASIAKVQTNPSMQLMSHSTTSTTLTCVYSFIHLSLFERWASLPRQKFQFQISLLMSNFHAKESMMCHFDTCQKFASYGKK